MTNRPNILFIMPDQLRADFLGCYGADFVRTPNIDRLAARGQVFDQAIAPFPICVPCRAAMLSGQSALETGVVDNNKWLRPDRREMGLETWPELLSEAGYHTASIGKMHFYPWDLAEGFAERIISEDKRHIWVEDDYAEDLARANLRKLHGNELQGYAETKGAGISGLPDAWQADRWVAEKTAAFLGRQRPDRPFAAFVGLPSPHCPYDPTRAALEAVDPARIPPPRAATKDSEALRHWMVENYRQPWADLDYEDLTPDQITAIRHHYVALIEMLDTEVGRILDALRDSGADRDTVVIFASDHGDFVGDYRMVGKTLFYEPSIRVPLILADPRAAGAHCRRPEPVALPDLFATMLDLAGIAAPPRSGEYRSLLQSGDPERMIFGFNPHGMMVRSPGFKLCRYNNGVQEAYDISADPGEQRNIFGDPAARPEIDRHDRYLAKSLMDGIVSANADKDISRARQRDMGGFAKRGWVRPYP